MFSVVFHFDPVYQVFKYCINIKCRHQHTSGWFFIYNIQLNFVSSSQLNSTRLDSIQLRCSSATITFSLFQLFHLLTFQAHLFLYASLFFSLLNLRYFSFCILTLASISYQYFLAVNVSISEFVCSFVCARFVVFGKYIKKSLTNIFTPET